MAKSSTNYEDKTILIAKFARALGHPARIAVLEYLASLDSCFFGDIHNELPIAKATVSQHLKELKNAGLIQGESQILHKQGELAACKRIVRRPLQKSEKKLPLQMIFSLHCSHIYELSFVLIRTKENG